MKNTGSCPKCRSSHVARVTAEPGGGHTPAVPVGVLTGLAMTRFVCCRCGYSEERVEAAADLAVVKKRYRTPPGRPPRAKSPRKG
jgi:hypothetical protein